MLFLLNGTGFIGGTILYLSKYWRKELYLVAAAYALLTIVAMFLVQGWTVEAILFMDGSIAQWRILSKTAEVLLIACSLYLFSNS